LLLLPLLLVLTHVGLHILSIEKCTLLAGGLSLSLSTTAAAEAHSIACSLLLLLLGAMHSTSIESSSFAALLLMLHPSWQTRSANSSAVAARDDRNSPTGLHANPLKPDHIQLTTTVFL
jgi:hypothetical protein